MNVVKLTIGIFIGVLLANLITALVWGIINVVVM